MIGSLKIFTDCVDCEYAVTQKLNKYFKRCKNIKINESTFNNNGRVIIEIMNKSKFSKDKINLMVTELADEGFIVDKTEETRKDYHSNELYFLEIFIRKN